MKLHPTAFVLALIGTLLIGTYIAGAQVPTEPRNVALLVRGASGDEKIAQAFEEALSKDIKQRTKKEVRALQLLPESKNKDFHKLIHSDWKALPADCEAALVVHVYRDTQTVEGLGGKVEEVTFLNVQCGYATIHKGVLVFSEHVRRGQSIPKDATPAQCADAINNLVKGTLNDKRFSPDR